MNPLRERAPAVAAAAASATATPSDAGRIDALEVRAADRRDCSVDADAAPAPGPLPDGRALLEVLDGVDYGLWLLDDQGCVRLANRSAMAACRRDGPFALLEGQLLVRDPGYRQRFLEAVHDARAGLRRMVRVAERGPRSMAAVVPHRGRRADQGPQCLVLLGRRGACEPLSLELFARTHQLTLAETLVLGGLSEGLSPAQIAQRLSVAVSTVRTQLNAIRAKTGTQSLRALMQQVSGLPPVMPRLDA